MKKQCYLLIPLTFRGTAATYGDTDRSHVNTNGIHWFTTVIPETFSMGIRAAFTIYSSENIVAKLTNAIFQSSSLSL